MDTFCLAIDNYFIVPKVIAALYEMDIRVVGTSHFRKAWCSMCKDTIHNQTRFNLKEEESQDSLNTLREKGK
eukprot:5835931-Ditylum_brightwellii.AAC.1